MLASAVEPPRELAIGGTAVGTGINAHPKFGEMTALKSACKSEKAIRRPATSSIR